jgi:acyl carrier protein
MPIVGSNSASIHEIEKESKKTNPYGFFLPKTVLYYLEKIIKIFLREEMKITIDLDLVEEAGLESIDLIEAIMAIEQVFGIEIHDNDIPDAVIRNFFQLIIRKLKESNRLLS